MTWETVKKNFTETLAPLYDIREAEQIFFLIISELGLTKVDFLFNKKNNAPEDKTLHIKDITKKLEKSIPIQHILGFGYFYERKFKVNKYVLIPRLETEELVHLILQKQSDFNIEVLDIGTGSGCIPISLKLENPEFKVSSIDISEEALEIAKFNALNLEAEVHFYRANILDQSTLTFENRCFDIIVSNPPYIRHLEKKKMNVNVLNFDPELALFVEDDKPLLFYEAIVQYALKKLKIGGHLYFEINEAFGHEVLSLMLDSGFINVEVVQDMQQKDRIVHGELKP